MGAYASNFHDDAGTLVSEFTDPSQENWLSAHVAATGLKEVEVAKMWSRFKELGAKEDGILVVDEVLTHPVAKDDIFLRNILSNLRTGNGVITFQTFLNAMKWAETTTLEEKVKGAFHLLNDSQTVTEEILSRVFKRVYVGESEETCKVLAKVFLEQIDDKQQGFITEEQFVRWAQTLPKETLDSVLEFHIVLPREDDSPEEGTETAMSFGKQAPSDKLLERISKDASKRDWHLLANKLGFTAAKIRAFENQYSSDRTQQVFEMLVTWRKEGETTVDDLEKALRESKMTDIALSLHP